MTYDEILEACQMAEEIEYHVEGVEQGAGLLPGPGWYSVLVAWTCEDSDTVEIIFTDPGIDDIGVTVLKKNIPIAFRRKTHVQESQA